MRVQVCLNDDAYSPCTWVQVEGPLEIKARYLWNDARQQWEWVDVGLETPDHYEDSFPKSRPARWVPKRARRLDDPFVR